MSRLALHIPGEPGNLAFSSFVGVLNRVRLILADLDSAISENPTGVLHWVLADLNMGSANAVLESRTRTRDARPDVPERVNQAFVGGLRTIEHGEHLPAYYSETSLKRVRAISRFLASDGGKPLTARDLDSELEASVSDRAAENVTTLIAPRYKTIGSVTGRLEMISVHGPKPRFNVYDVLSQRPVRCTFDHDQLEDVRAALNRRVVVTGIVHRNANGEAIRVESPTLRPMRSDAELPTTDDIVGIAPDFTGDLTAEEYVRQLRNA